jgi:hypothetical protein
LFLKWEMSANPSFQGTSCKRRFACLLESWINFGGWAESIRNSAQAFNPGAELYLRYGEGATPANGGVFPEPLSNLSILGSAIS